MMDMHVGVTSLGSTRAADRGVAAQVRMTSLHLRLFEVYSVHLLGRPALLA